MDNNQPQFTDRATKIINDAAQLAVDHANSFITPIHFLASMVQKDQDGNPSLLETVVEKARYDWAPVEREVNRQLVRVPSQNPAPQQPELDNTGKKVLTKAQDFMKKQKDEYVGQDHFLYALLEISTIEQLFKGLSISVDALKKQIQAVRGNRRIDSRMADSSQQYEFLSKYAQDLTTLAREGKIDPVIGREDEIRRCIRVLARRTKCNPCLIGDPGVGKTSIVEGVAQRIIDGDVPNILANCLLFSLDLGALVAGAKYQGDFEERIKGVLKEIEESHDMIILFVDEIHMLMGDGKNDAANLLKPMLARGTLHCIGATTVEEYRKHVEKDGAFERRFQKVDVREPTVRETVAILRGLQSKYELHHGVRILDSAMVTAAQLASRYLTYRKLPDSAVDLIDESAANVAVTRDSKPERMDTLDRELELLQVEIAALKRDADADQSTTERLEIAKKRAAEIEEELGPLRERFEQERSGHEELNQLKKKLDDLETKAQDASRRRDTAAAADINYYAIPAVKEQIDKLEAEIAAKDKNMLKDVVDAEQVSETAAKLTGIPVSKLSQAENSKLINMEKVLSKQVVGQPEAVKAVSNAIRLSRSGLANPKAPASFMFLGSSGSGKTELAKSLAGFLFADEKAMIRIDCSELGEKFSASKLIGAAPGYVGYEQGGILTEALARKPYSVVLFDEVEKAAPGVLTVLLQVLDDGHIRSSQGKLVNCANCIVIMTSNLGAEFINRCTSSHIDPVTREQVMAAVKAHFRPEFLNRISGTIVFNKLSKKAIRKIVRIRLDEIEQRFAGNNKHLSLQLTEECYDYLVENGYSPDLGARPLNRLVQNEILNKLAILLLRGEVQDNEVVQVERDRDGLKVLGNHEPTNESDVMEVDDEEVSDDEMMGNSDLD